MSDDGKRELPVTPEQAFRGDEEGADTGPAFETDGGPHPPAADVPSWRLISTLAVAGALAGLLIVGVFQWAEPQILEHKAQVTAAAVAEVLAEPDHVQSLYVVGDGLSPTPPAGIDTITAEKVFLGFNAQDRPVGFAVQGAEPGFQDVIQLIFGYDPVTKQVLGMRVLDSKETPGLGDKITKDQKFIAGFDNVTGPIRGVKEGAGEGKDNEVDMITGATISSRAVIRIINDRLEALDPVLTRYMAQQYGAGVAGPVAPPATAGATSRAAAAPSPDEEGGAE